MEYTARNLQAFALNYDIKPLPYIIFTGEVAFDPWPITEFRLDFDKALRNIGPGPWSGKLKDFKFIDFKQYNTLQRVIIAQIVGITDQELKFKDVSKLRAKAYKLMAEFLND